ncbi:unnamed protein product [Caretta caretta]
MGNVDRTPGKGQPLHPFFMSTKGKTYQWNGCAIPVLQTNIQGSYSILTGIYFILPRKMPSNLMKNLLV